MSASLDRGRNYGDRGGTVSDPMLIHRVGQVKGNTPEEIAAAKAHVHRSFPTDSPEDLAARADIEAMLFSPPNYRTVNDPMPPVSFAAAREALAERRANAERKAAA